MTASGGWVSGRCVSPALWDGAVDPGTENFVTFDTHGTFDPADGTVTFTSSGDAIAIPSSGTLADVYALHVAPAFSTLSFEVSVSSPTNLARRIEQCVTPYTPARIVGAENATFDPSDPTTIAVPMVGAYSTATMEIAVIRLKSALAGREATLGGGWTLLTLPGGAPARLETHVSTSAGTNYYSTEWWWREHVPGTGFSGTTNGSSGTDGWWAGFYVIDGTESPHIGSTVAADVNGTATGMSALPDIPLSVTASEGGGIFAHGSPATIAANNVAVYGQLDNGIGSSAPFALTTTPEGTVDYTVDNIAALDPLHALLVTLVSATSTATCFDESLAACIAGGWTTGSRPVGPRSTWS